MSLRHDRYLCLDLELTCWDGAPPDGMRPEIVEVGIVEADGKTHAIRREARYMVRPVVSTVSPYLTALTGITSEEIARIGRPFAEVLRTVAKDFGPARKRLVTWGDDWTTLEHACVAVGTTNPFPRDNVVDVGAMMSLARGVSGSLSLVDALALYGLSFEGPRHRAVVDAGNTVRVVGAMAARLTSGTEGPST